VLPKTTVAGRRYPLRSSLPVLWLDLSELGVVEGLGVPEAEAVGRVVRVERPHVEDAEVLVLVAVVEAVRVPHPLDVGGLGAEPDDVGGDEGHAGAHDDRQRRQAEVPLHRRHRQALHGLEAVALGQGPLHAGAGGLAEQEPRETHFEPGAGNLR